MQAIYGQYFYTSTILIAWPWFLLLVLLVVAYYGFYFVTYNGQRRPGPAGIVLFVSLVLVLIIAFIPIHQRHPHADPHPLGSQVLRLAHRLEQ